MEQELQSLADKAKETLESLSESSQLEEFRIQYLGRKGQFNTIMRQLGEVAKEDRPRIGQLANSLKSTLEERFQEKLSALQSTPTGDTTKPDLTLPGRMPQPGKVHPVTRVMSDACAIFENLGFSIAEGPDIESDYYNFEALNIPAHHPARDMHDTFYVNDSVLLRTHTSPMQARVMEAQDPPLRLIAPGKVYRCDSDITHTPMFHQVEGLLVDVDVSFSVLKGTLEEFLQMFFEQDDLKTRFRPSYFPFTEPSMEVDISCVMCSGQGCRVCSHTGWLEVLGCGMVHPELFRHTGVDGEKYTGYAFGMGVERLAMLRYGVNDLRLFFDNDLRFLQQFT